MFFHPWYDRHVDKSSLVWSIFPCNFRGAKSSLRIWLLWLPDGLFPNLAPWRLWGVVLNSPPVLNDAMYGPRRHGSSMVRMVCFHSCVQLYIHHSKKINFGRWVTLFCENQKINTLSRWFLLGTSWWTVEYVDNMRFLIGPGMMIFVFRWFLGGKLFTPSCTPT